MKTILLICGMCMVVCGCRGGGGSELLERELRLQEDRLFQLQDALDQCQAMLDASRRENEAIKKEIVGGDRGAAPESGVPGEIAAPLDSNADQRRTGQSAVTPKRNSSPRRKPAGEPDIVPGVEVEPGIPTDPEEIPSSEDAPRRRTPGRGASNSVTDKRVVKLALNKQLTGGLSHDGQHGDEGIMVVFEPRNAAGQLVKTPGDVSIVVIDPKLTGAAARVARWDFTADEVSQHFSKTGVGPGLHFELPWPSQPPKNLKLQLFVRYTTSDGRKLTADQPISVDNSDRHVKNWKQSASNDSKTDRSKPDSKLSASEQAAKNGATARDLLKRREPQFLTSKNPGSNVSSAKARAAKESSSSRDKPTDGERHVSSATIAASEPGDVIRIPDGPNDPDIRAAAEARALAEAQAGGVRGVSESPRSSHSDRRGVEAVAERPTWKPYR